MSDTNAKIRGKGLEHTGVTEDHAAQMYDRVGSHYVGVVDLKVVRRSDDDNGNRTVELTIESIELASTDDTAEHIRRLTRALHYERGLAINGGDQLPLEGSSDEPTVDQVRAAGRAHEIDPEADEREAARQEAADAAQDAPDTSGDENEDGGQSALAEPWEYPQPEGSTANDSPASTVSSPFDVPDPDPVPAA